MDCPKCQCKEISSSGTCLWCGYQVIAPAAENKPDVKEEQNTPDQAETDTSKTPDESAQEEIPAWRQELARRLQSLKEEREAPVDSEQLNTEPLPATENNSEEPGSSGPPESHPEAAPHSYAPIQVEFQQSDQVRSSLQESKSRENAGFAAISPGRKSTENDIARDLIDSRVSPKAERSETPAEAAEYLFQAHAALNRKDDWMILLSRTISGLVDLFIVALCTSFLIIAANLFSGIRVLDARSVLHYSLLLLLMYFLYSLFFLLTISQTIGMMTTGLHVVAGTGKKRPQALRILARCFSYLLSTLCLGVGLLWSLFDEEHQCLHDRLTDTRVVPIYNANS
jgi:uncharacterized RDD family membrane protein YckC